VHASTVAVGKNLTGF